VAAVGHVSVVQVVASASWWGPRRCC